MSINGGRALRVSVVGAGILGLSTAYYLLREGAEVVVFDEASIGAGPSGGNAGEICATSSDPLPSAGMLREGIGQLFKPSSAFYVHPAQIPSMAPFLLGFAMHSNERSYRNGLAALDRLNEMTQARYDELAADGIGRSLRHDGYVYCYRDATAAAGGRDRAVRLARRGLAPEPSELLSGAQLRELEPTISLTDGWGYHQPGVQWIDPRDLLADLASWLRGHGVVIHEQARVEAIRDHGASSDVRRPGGVEIRTAAGTHTSDVVVLAAGIRSLALARSLGVNLAMQPGKGYSFSVKPDVMPGHVVNMPEVHVVATPMSTGLRLAGTMEFDGTPDRMNPRRIEAIVNGARGYLDGIDWTDLHEQWVGARPMTPDGLPHIGALARHPSVFVVTGHNMLGLSLGPSSGAVAAGLVVGKLRSSDYAAFSPERFSVLRRLRRTPR